VVITPRIPPSKAKQLIHIDRAAHEIGREDSVSDLEIMEKFGIWRAQADFYHYKQYRYTTLKDAIAQAERDGAVLPTKVRKPDDPV
jgi:hypothetical protein